jgi:hypothetical protein
LHKRRLRLTSLRLALANSSVKSSGMGACGHAHPVKTPVSNAYRFISGNFQLRPEPSKHVPKFVYKDQGIAPGNGSKEIFSANGAAHHSGGVVWCGCQNVRHDGSGRWPLVAFADGFLGRCPRLGWHRAVGPQESARITRDLDCSPIFRANGAPPSQPGHRPNMALQGQRPPSSQPGASPWHVSSGATPRRHPSLGHRPRKWIQNDIQRQRRGLSGMRRMSRRAA